MSVFQVFQLYTSRTLKLNLVAVNDDLCIREILFETSLICVHLLICLRVGNGKRSLNSLERKQIHVVNKRLYVPSLTPKHTHTSATSKPGLKWITNENSWLATDILCYYPPLNTWKAINDHVLKPSKHGINAIATSSCNLCCFKIILHQCCALSNLATELTPLLIYYHCCIPFARGWDLKAHQIFLSKQNDQKCDLHP